MQNRKPHSQKAPQTGHSIFGTILFSLLAVLAVEFLLLTFAVHVTRLGPQLNQNAEDILAMQVDNRSRYLQSIFHDAQQQTDGRTKDSFHYIISPIPTKRLTEKRRVLSFLK